MDLSSPFLNKGVIFAYFQHWSNRPVSIVDLNLIVIGSVSSMAFVKFKLKYSILCKF